MKFGELKVTTFVLVLQGFLGLYQGTKFPAVYLPFALLDFLLAWGTYTRRKTAIKVSLVYLAIDLFLAIFYLISGVLLKGIIALLDFLAIHDMVSYIEELYREEQSL
ncbi:hypothetical protein [Thermococcus sp. AM4]|uniref:hypothetical protein n=1 Tax=Thermococcus sp. (strain AM4) TaxID=246969 RepID=UPI0001871056|nr:hypothetical protein [Thermococcus sp. AM4]EEB73163.1 hypothetical protein TAM4_2020 [Thermococcus sp. AM4]